MNCKLRKDHAQEGSDLWKQHASISYPDIKAGYRSMLHRHDAIGKHDSNRQFSSNLLYVIGAVYTPFLIYFSANLFYIPKTARPIHEVAHRGKEEKIDPKIFKR